MVLRVALDGIDIKRLIALLVRNKAPLIAITPEQGAVQRALCADPLFAEAQAAERAQYESLRAEYELAKALWQQAGIDDVLIKSPAAFPSFPYRSSNLDALVRRADGDRARQLLRAHGYVELRNVEENRKYLFRKFHRGAEMLGLHVHEHVGWYASFVDEEALWPRRRPSPDHPLVSVPSAGGHRTDHLGALFL